MGGDLVAMLQARMLLPLHLTITVTHSKEGVEGASSLGSVLILA